MKHLPPTFNWQDFLDWAEQISPDAPLDEVKKVFDMGCAKGNIKPAYVDEEGNFTYELCQSTPVRMVVAVVKKDYKPERDD